MIKLLATEIVSLLMLCITCIAETNSPSHVVATNETDLARFTKINEERIQKGQGPLLIQLSPEFDKKLVSQGILPPIGSPTTNRPPETTRLRFDEVPVAMILAEYSRLSGKKILNKEKARGIFTLETTNWIPTKEAIILIEDRLKQDGIFLETIDKKTLRVITGQPKR